MVIECAFGRLKARFGVLRRAMDINLAELPFEVDACFVLHNVCEDNMETIGEELVAAVIYDKEFQSPIQTNSYPGDLALND